MFINVVSFKLRAFVFENSIKPTQFGRVPHISRFYHCISRNDIIIEHSWRYFGRYR